MSEWIQCEAPSSFNHWRQCQNAANWLTKSGSKVCDRHKDVVERIYTGMKCKPLMSATTKKTTQ